MRSSFLGLESAKRSIQLSQKALDITMHNMSNYGVDGYSRQRVDTSALYLKSYANWQTKMSKLSLGGQGSVGLGIARIRDSYVDKRYRDMICSTEQYGKTATLLKEVETVFDNVQDNSTTTSTNTGLMGALDEIINAISNAATNAADNRELSSIIRNSCVNFCATIRSADAELKTLKERNVFELGTSIEGANDIIQKITDLNERIVKEYTATEFGTVYNGDSVSRYGPLELMDQRDLLVDELAKYVDIHVDNNNDGSYKISVGGVTIVDGTQNKKFVLRSVDDYGAAVINFSDGTNANTKIKHGTIQSYLEVLNGNGPYAAHYQTGDYGIPYYQSALDAFTSKFAELMNEYNGAGMNYDPVTNQPYYDDVTRCLFGSYDDKVVDGVTVERVIVTAANIKVSDEWLNDECLIGQVKVHHTDEVRGAFAWDSVNNDYAYDLNGNRILDPYPQTVNGQDYYDFDSEGYLLDSNGDRVTVEYDTWNSVDLDGTALNKLILMFDQPTKFGRANDFNGSLSEYMYFISNRCAQNINYLDTQHEAYQNVTDSLLDSRDAVSAVDDTEEGVNMMTFQKWFNASSRMMTALDECLDRIINNMGKVGL